MFLSTSRPASTQSLAGTGAAFLTDADALVNGRPGDATRIQWLSGAQTTASILYLRANFLPSGSFPGGYKIKLVGLVGLSLPVGIKIIAAGRFDLSWNYRPVEGTVVEREDGVRVAWFHFAEEDDYGGEYITAVEFQIYNDVGGATVMTAGQAFDVGEIWAGLGGQWCIRPSYESGRDDLSTMRSSIGGQPFPVRRRASATSQVEFTPVVYGDAFGDSGLSVVRQALLGYQPAVVVPMTAEPFTGNAIEQSYINKFAEFGYCSKVGPITGEAPRFVMSAGFVAPPPILP